MSNPPFLSGAGYVGMPSGLILPEHVARAQVTQQAKPKAVDFFAGAGGFSLGFIQAGYEVVAAVEWDVSAVITYMMNLCRYGEVTMHYVEPSDRKRMENELRKSYRRQGITFDSSGGLSQSSKLRLDNIFHAGSGWIAHEPATTPGVKHIFVGDVRKLTSNRILEAIGLGVGELDTICGGPPCQGFSRAGKQDVMDPRNSLVFEYARFIVEMRPKTLVMEEVPAILDMVTPEGVPVVEAFCRILEDGGFAGLDALKRSIAHQTGAVGLLRGKAKKAASERPRPEATPSAQIDMFEVV